MAIESLFIELAKTSVKELTPFPVSTVLIYLIDELTQQENSLSRLERKLEDHMIAPFKVGKVYLDEARHAPDERTRRENVTAAKREFITVSQVNLPNYPMLPVKTNFYIGVCYDLLSENKSAVRWYEKAHQLIVDMIIQNDPRRRLRKDWPEQEIINDYKGAKGLFQVKIVKYPDEDLKRSFKQLVIPSFLERYYWAHFPGVVEEPKEIFIFAAYLTDLLTLRKSLLAKTDL